MPLNLRMQWNAGTACVSECVLKMLACRGLRVGPSKYPLRVYLKLVADFFPAILGALRRRCLRDPVDALLIIQDFNQERKRHMNINTFFR